MSAYVDQSDPILRTQFQKLLNEYRDLALSEADEEQKMTEVANTMKQIALTIMDRRLLELADNPTLFPNHIIRRRKSSARPTHGESDCRAFKKYGSCKRGNRCIWRHDPKYKRKKEDSSANHSQQASKDESQVPAHHRQEHIWSYN